MSFRKVFVFDTYVNFPALKKNNISYCSGKGIPVHVSQKLIATWREAHTFLPLFGYQTTKRANIKEILLQHLFYSSSRDK